MNFSKYAFFSLMLSIASYAGFSVAGLIFGGDTIVPIGWLIYFALVSGNSIIVILLMLYEIVKY